MFSSFPTTRHASDLERRTTETGDDGRGDDFDAHGARTWASNGFLSRDGFSDAEDDDDFEEEEEEEDGDGGSKAGKGRRRGVAKNVAQLSKSPRSPKEAFDGNTGNARDALFPIRWRGEQLFAIGDGRRRAVEHAEDLGDMFSLQRRRRFGETTDWDEQVSTESWDCSD